MPEKTSDCPRKLKKKVGEKKISVREKNQEKYQKPFSRALFNFSGKKKTLLKLSLPLVINLVYNPMQKALEIYITPMILLVPKKNGVR